MRPSWARGLFGGAAVVMALALQPSASWADTLFKAMEKAYVTNPSLNAARAGQRATDELVPQALSGWRPTITVQGDVESESVVANTPLSAGTNRSLQHDRTESGSLAMLSDFIGKPVSLQVETQYSQEQYDVVLM